MSPTFTTVPARDFEAEAVHRGVTWTSTTLGSLAYALFAIQQPGPVVDLRTRAQAQAEGIISPAQVHASLGPESDPFMRRQNVLADISQLDL